MYLYTDRVYNHKIDDYINSTSMKQLGGLFFPPNFSNNNKIFQLNRFKEND